jgi:hypothetical protein
MGVEMGPFSFGMMQLVKMIKFPVVPVFYERNKSEMGIFHLGSLVQFWKWGGKTNKLTNNN